MRFIDADDTVKILRGNRHAIEYSDLDEGYDLGIDDCIDEIQQAPSVDVSPIVHARWIPKDPNPRTGKAYYYHCSNCGDHVYHQRQLSVKELGYAFCPHCGAKMDEENA